MIDSIETYHAGILFRSRAEARWAAFLRRLNVDWRYEPQTFSLNGVGYLPDFYLPAFDAWLEIKPPLGHDLSKPGALAATGRKVLVLAGVPGRYWVFSNCKFARLLTAKRPTQVGPALALLPARFMACEACGDIDVCEAIGRAVVCRCGGAFGRGGESVQTLRILDAIGASETEVDYSVPLGAMVPGVMSELRRRQDENIENFF